MHRAIYVTEAGRPRRKSSFQEIGLDDGDSVSDPATAIAAARCLEKIDEGQSRPPSSHMSTEALAAQCEGRSDEPGASPHGVVIARSPRFPILTRLTMAVALLATVLSLTQSTWITSGKSALPVVEAVPASPRPDPAVAKRADSPTTVCKRWSGQSAVVNGTLYYYGGRATTEQSQTDNEWNNNLISLDLTQSWDIGSPTFSGLPQPSGPPAVANGYLWNSHTSLFLYGGEFSDSPVESPVAFSLWEYDISSSSWKEHSDPKTSSATNSGESGVAVERVAEGAGANMPSLGRGWYFGGHQDFLTTEGWSIQVGREYLKSFVEFTFPGTSNDAIGGLSGAAGDDGAWRNITEAGIQDTAGFTERADGVLVYVPGFGEDGILVALGGGTNESFTQMNVIDVYDVEGSKWYKQATSGPTPGIRVNPCAVVAAAPDGSSYNIYMFGGQNLVPYEEQTQYQDMWILTMPAFTWINVTMHDQAVPYGRSGHTCNMWDGQMVVVGGYIGQEISCESPGVYVFNASSLQWATKYTSLSSGEDNTFSQQSSQKGVDPSKAGLEGSYGYTVPDVVVSAIGGNSFGRATVTAPVQSATAGPLATGKPITYTVTGPNGATVTETGTAGTGGTLSSGHGTGGGSGTNVGAIVAGVIAGIFAILAAYLGFCAWLYRKQLKLYKNHVAMQQRAAADPARMEKDAFMLPATAKNSSDRTSGERSASHAHSGSGRAYTTASSGNMPPGANGRAYHPLQQTSTQSGRSEAGSSTEDLLANLEPTFVGVLLNPKRSLRIVNRD